VPDRNNPNVTYLYGNTAFAAVDTGFEAQIDEEARGDTRFSEPDGFPYNRTGAIYKITSIGTNPGQQDYVNTQQLAANTWHTYEIEISGQTYVVRLNGQPSRSIHEHRQLSRQTPERGSRLGLHRDPDPHGPSGFSEHPDQEPAVTAERGRRRPAVTPAPITLPPVALHFMNRIVLGVPTLRVPRDASRQRLNSQEAGHSQHTGLDSRREPRPVRVD
jgi:hypothetical protein